MSSPPRNHARTRRPREEAIGRVERIEVTLDGLRELHSRIADQRLEPDDWLLFAVLVEKQIGRIEGRLERMMAKLAAEAAAAAAEDAENTDDASESVCGVDNSVHDDESESHPAPSDANTPNDTEPAARSAGGNNAQDKRAPEKRKGHGRNGMGAYRKAKHFFYALGVGVLGAVCNRCGFGKMYRYREKVIIRIVGQPLFSAEIHHYEQARCRHCGFIIRATGPAHICEGVGSDYIRYDWSACGMLMVMHYSAGAPFKRLDSLHDGWGVPMSDANQWQVVNAADDLLLPLYKALEHHAIRPRTSGPASTPRDSTGRRPTARSSCSTPGVITPERWLTNCSDVACSRAPSW
jgi:hypothetical protein